MRLSPYFVLALLVPHLALAQQPPEPEPGTSVDATFGEGLTFRDEENGFSLTLRARMQARASFTELYAPRIDTPITGAAIRRARLLLTGSALNEVDYYLQLGFSNQDTEPDLRLPLRDAYLTWRRFRDVRLRVGQMKVPFDRQRVTSSSALQMVDRSLVISELSLDRDVGLVVMSDDLFGLDELLSYRVGVFGGEGRNRITEAEGVLWMARLEVKPLGGFEDVEESDIQRTPSPRLAVGGGVGRNQRSVRALSTFGETFASGRVSYEHATADVHFKWSGFSFIASALYRRAVQPVVGTIEGGELEFSRSGWGAFAQSGFFVSERVELTGRFGQLRPLAVNRSDLAVTRELGGGLNWFISGHDLKIQADYFYLFGRAFSGGNHQVRVQTQLYF